MNVQEQRCLQLARSARERPLKPSRPAAPTGARAGRCPAAPPAVTTLARPRSSLPQAMPPGRVLLIGSGYRWASHSALPDASISVGPISAWIAGVGVGCTSWSTPRSRKCAPRERWSVLIWAWCAPPQLPRPNSSGSALGGKSRPVRSACAVLFRQKAHGRPRGICASPPCRPGRRHAACNTRRDAGRASSVHGEPKSLYMVGMPGYFREGVRPPGTFPPGLRPRAVQAAGPVRGSRHNPGRRGADRHPHTPEGAQTAASAPAREVLLAPARLLALQGGVGGCGRGYGSPPLHPPEVRPWRAPGEGQPSEAGRLPLPAKRLLPPRGPECGQEHRSQPPGQPRHTWDWRAPVNRPIAARACSCQPPALDVGWLTKFPSAVARTPRPCRRCHRRCPHPQVWRC